METNEAASARLEALAPYAEALSDHQAGAGDVRLRLWSSLGEDDEIPAAVFFRSPDELFPFEVHALDLCRGSVLDLGAGTGVHALELQRRGLDVTAVELVPELVEIQRARGVRRAIRGDLATWMGGPFDTVLLLMNGIGPTGTLRGMERFLVHAQALVAPSGQLIFDSGDAQIEGPVDPGDAARWPPTDDGYRGEAWIELGYGGRRGPPFRELYADVDVAAERAAGAGWSFAVAFEGEGSYLARLTRP